MNTHGNWRAAAAAEYAERRAALLKQRDAYRSRMARLQAKATGVENDLAALDAGARVFGLEVQEQEPARGLFASDPALQDRGAGTPEPRGSGQFKDLALQFLSSQYPRRFRAPEVQAHIEAALGRQFHWKTAGMTLYRLKTEGRVSREGQLWFYVPPDEQDAARERERMRLEERRRELAQDPGEQGPDETLTAEEMLS